MIREQWQANIVARELLEAKARIPSIATLLYPEIPLANDRIARLRLEGGDIISRIEEVSKTRATLALAEMQEWWGRGGAF